MECLLLALFDISHAMSSSMTSIYRVELSCIDILPFTDLITGDLRDANDLDQSLNSITTLYGHEVIRESAFRVCKSCVYYDTKSVPYISLSLY